MIRSKQLPHPITIEINERPVTFVTLGSCAEALHRTSTCLRYWETLGLFPPAAYRLSRNQARLYPVDFLRAIRLIADQDYFGPRLNRSNWRRFQSEVWGAHDNALRPIRDRGNGVKTPPAAGTIDEGGQG